MSEEIQLIEQGGEKDMNTIAVEVIQTAKTHDEFFAELKIRGVDFGTELPLLNLVKRLSDPKGYMLNQFRALAAEHPLAPKSAKNVPKTVGKMHTLVEKLLGNQKLLDGMSETHTMIPETIEEVRREIDWRTQIAELTEQTEGLPGYCEVGNEALRGYYEMQHPKAKAFIFQCLQFLMAKGNTFSNLVR